MRIRLGRSKVFLLGTIVCAVVACGDGGAGEAVESPPSSTVEGAPETSVESEEASETSVESEGDASLSLDRITMATHTGDYLNAIIWTVANHSFWPELGFEGMDEVAISDDYLAGLIGGSAWIVEAESDAIWGALEEGSVDMTVVGVHQDRELHFLAANPDVDITDISGYRITGGEPGARNVIVAENVLKELGFDPEDNEFITVPGGPEARFAAMVAGQVDLAILQVEQIELMPEIDGQVVYNERVTVPQATWAVLTETMENNRDAVCAFVLGELQARQWLSAGDAEENQDEAIEIGREYGLEPAEVDLNNWKINFIGGTNSMDGGATVESFNQWTEDMVSVGIVSEDFNWSEHVDFSCLWEAQEALDLEPRPNPDEMP